MSVSDQSSGYLKTEDVYLKFRNSNDTPSLAEEFTARAEDCTPIAFQLSGSGLGVIGAQTRIECIRLPSFKHLRVLEPHGPTYAWRFAYIADSASVYSDLPDHADCGTLHCNNSKYALWSGVVPPVTVIGRNNRISKLASAPGRRDWINRQNCFCVFCFP